MNDDQTSTAPAIGPWFLFTALGVAVVAVYAAFSAVVFGIVTPNVVASFAGNVCLNLIVIALAARAFSRQDRLRPAITAYLIMTITGLAVAIGIGLYLPVLSAGPYAAFLLVLPILPALLILFFDLGIGAGSLAVGGIIGIASLTTFANVGENVPPPRVVEPVFDPALLYPRQNAKIASQAEALRPGEPGRVELFAILGAGYPEQQIFGREVRHVDGLLQQDFGAEGRTLRLINDRTAPDAEPLLTAANLDRALQGVAAAMNKDEDILLLFLTSHGQPNRFRIAFDPLIYGDLTPDQIGVALDRSDIRNIVAIVSACFSGSFVDALKGANRLVLTAAARDRSSFGCNDANEFTDWGRAFFVDTFPETGDFIDAAQQTRNLVAAREEEQGYEPSLPQIIIGQNIPDVLEQWMGDRAR